MTPVADIPAALRDAILAGPGLPELLAERVYPGQAPQNAARPYIVYGQIGKDPDLHHGGRGDCDRDLYDVHCVSDGYAEAKRMARLVDAAMDPATMVSPVIGAALLQDEYDQSEPAGTGGDDRIHTVILQFAIWPK